MRIAVLCTATTRHQAGGTEVHAEFIARLAAAKGHTVTCITSAREDGAEQETKDGYTTCYLPGTDHRMSRSQAPAWWRESAKKISELAAKDGLDVIWAENLSGQYYASRFRERVGVPVISIIQGLGVAGEIKSAYGRVDSFGELAYFLTRYAAQIVFYYIPRFRRMVRFSDRLIAISRETLEAASYITLSIQGASGPTPNCATEPARRWAFPGTQDSCCCAAWRTGRKVFISG